MTLLAPPPAAALAASPTSLRCAGCGYAVPAGEMPLRCPRAKPGDDIDHLVTRTIAADRLAFPYGDEPNPFVRYRSLWHAYQLARSAGRSDADLVGEIEQLDAAVAAVDGHGFTVTPLAPAAELAAALELSDAGALLIKDETANVAGSHKARHLFGTLLALRMSGHDDPHRPLAIASCGNAALAAAVVARAARRRLLVFVPSAADESVVGRLFDLGAQVTTCPRRPGERGDPTVSRLREALARGAVAFTCQGNENGLAIEGGLTLGYEIAQQLREAGRDVDHLFVQVGGGALASSVIQGLAEAQALGVLHALPRIHAVQTRNSHPLARAYERVVERIGEGADPDATAETLDWAARHRSALMWPWTPPPRSIASGILDDETYDWLAVVRGMLATDGRPALVGERELREANRLARATTAIDVDVTGTAGLAGLMALRRRGEVLPDERCAVLFTGIRRDGGSP